VPSQNAANRQANRGGETHMEFLTPLLQREAIISLAVVGAIIATGGGIMLKKPNAIDPVLARMIYRLGCAVSSGSVVLFIIAGFVGA